MDKKTVAAALEEIALLLELAGENPFKVRAYQSGARTVLSLPGNLQEVLQRGDLEKVKGIGKSLAAVIAELAAKDEAALRLELKAKIPPGLLDLLQVPGLGPQKARVLFEQLQIASLGELEYAIRENRLLALPGFGAKTQERLKTGLERLKRYAGLFRLGDLLPAAQDLLALLRREPPVLRAEMAGGVRRGLEVDDAITLVAVLAQPEEGLAALTALIPGARVPSREPGRLEAVLPPGIPLTVVATRSEVFGAAWLLATGNPGHLQELQLRARKAGLRLTTEGLFSQNQLLPSADEEEIYRRLGLPFIPPELREGLGELQAATQGGLPRLLRGEDVRGCLHVHSHYSDGVNTLEELLSAVRERGWDFLGLADHSQSAYYAGGLKPPDLERQKTEIEVMRQKFTDLSLFWGIEADILTDGTLDYPDEILAGFDFVIASVHSQFGLPRPEMTGRLLKAMSNPFCTMVGHITGRLLLAREPYEVDLEPLLEFAGQHRVIMELNASPYRLDLDWRWLRRAKELGVLVSLNPDAHSLEGLDDVAFGVMAARKGWLEPQDVLNTYPPAEVARLLRRRVASG